MSNRSDDPVDLLTRYAPTSETLGAEWDRMRPAGLAERITHDEQPNVVTLVSAGPTRRPRRMGLIVAASAAVIVALTGALVVTLSRGSDTPAGQGRVFDPPPGLSTSHLTNDQHAYRVLDVLEVDRSNRVVGGAERAIRVTIVPGKLVSTSVLACRLCPTRYPELPLRTPFAPPTPAAWSALPTDVDGLTAYLRRQVSGHSGANELIFRMVGVNLRLYDAMASQRLRAAMIAVLSRLPGVRMDQHAHDFRGRAAIRLDYEGHAGVVRSLYFDPKHYHLLEERTRTVATGQSLLIVLRSNQIFEGTPAPGHSPH